jgi:type VI secretion system protein VasD
LRVYELKNATAFNSADFVALYERDKAELAADIVSREEIILQPGETRPVAAKTLALEVRFIAVMGAFRDLERSQWRSVAAVLPGQKQRIVIRADGLAVSVTVSK